MYVLDSSVGFPPIIINLDWLDCFLNDDLTEGNVPFSEMFYSLLSLNYSYRFLFIQYESAITPKGVEPHFQQIRDYIRTEKNMGSLTHGQCVFPYILFYIFCARLPYGSPLHRYWAVYVDVYV